VLKAEMRKINDFDAGITMGANLSNSNSPTDTSGCAN